MCPAVGTERLPGARSRASVRALPGPHRGPRVAGIPPASLTGYHPTVNRGRRARPFVVEHLGASLLAMRVDALRSMADLLDLSRQLRAAMDGIPGSIIGCADYRLLRGIDGEVADGLVELIRQANPKVRRSALLMPIDASTSRLQLDQVLRQGHAERRICADVAEAKAWLSSHLDAAERARLGEFLAPRGR
jgi:hypothetical protein